jgi:hypothetical protein
MLAGDGSHSTDQSSRRAQGQGKGRVGSSRHYLKNIKLARLSILILSKAYPFHGILSHITRLMKAYKSSGFSFSQQK